jgi:DNA helicase HerA-like ATPase
MAETYGPLLIARGETDIGILPKMANRHGLVAGATGTGKTVTLRVLAEHFSSIGVPIFMADVKGDLSGICRPGGEVPKIAERVEDLKLKDFKYQSYPVVFWDPEGVQGHPVRTTISEMGPLLLGRLLNLNEIQSGVLNLIFKIADDNGLLLLDLKDLRAMAQFVGDSADQFRTTYGNVSSASVGAIQRSLLAIEQQGADKLFGEPALNLDDLIQTSAQGQGVVNILVADQLIQAPSRYATFLLWLLSDLYERLPEVGDPPKPKLIFFFDEAHLLFEDAPKALVDKIEQIVRLVRSKGVGVYFVTQNPLDLPDRVLGQLGNRVQHALRAFTPRDQKNVKAAAETFRPNPKVDALAAITELGVGEALVSVLDEKGTPTKVDRAWVLPPQSRLTPLTPEERDQVVRGSVLYGHYEKTVDRESAYEILKARAESTQAEEAGKAAPKRQPPTPVEEAGKILLDMGKSAARSAGTQIGRQIMRGILGSIFGKK